VSKKKSKSALSVKPGVTNAQALNPNLGGRLKRSVALSADDYVAGIRTGDLSILSRAITLVESQLETHQELAEQVINACLPYSGNSMRIGITGIPGVGKSTFIEAFGLHLIQQQHKKVAVLAVDPSSQKTKGSIMGDKTRMEKLSQLPEAFIRPSPSAGSLGGVARKTRETAILCEAAGFDTIIIETVGVGQSETAVKRMVDYFLLLLLPGAGDELQGIKRGIMEMADGIAINKADGDNLKRAQVAAADVKRAIHLFPSDQRAWQVPVDTCSSLHNTGIEKLWENAERFQRHMKTKGFFNANREEQSAWWLRETISDALLQQFYKNDAVAARYNELERAIKTNQVSPFTAARQLLRLFLRK
jgi:LAO/AO transport system kinase